MDLIEILISMILFLLAAGSFTVSCFYFREKGLIIFLLNGFQLLFDLEWLFYGVMGTAVTAVIYAVISSVRMK